MRLPLVLLLGLLALVWGGSRHNRRIGGLGNRGDFSAPASIVEGERDENVPISNDNVVIEADTPYDRDVSTAAGASGVAGAGQGARFAAEGENGPDKKDKKADSSKAKAPQPPPSKSAAAEAPVPAASKPESLKPEGKDDFVHPKIVASLPNGGSFKAAVAKKNQVHAEGSGITLDVKRTSSKDPKTGAEVSEKTETNIAVSGKAAEQIAAQVLSEHKLEQQQQAGNQQKQSKVSR